MSKRCSVMIALLLLVIAGGIYKFIFQGSVASGKDGRIAIQLNSDEGDLVLTEMRAFLTTVQQVTRGISEEDMQLVAESSRKAGRAAQAEVPGTLMGKLPLQFKQLGSDTHAGFDQMALDAEDLGDSRHALSQLAALMQNCTACHAAFRFEIAEK